MLQQQTQSPGWRVLNRDVIKYIAVTAMLLNHIANIFLVPGTLWYEELVDIGYFTAITMCYAQGRCFCRQKSVRHANRL